MYDVTQDPVYKELMYDYECCQKDIIKIKNTLKDIIANTKQAGAVSREGSLLSAKDWEKLIAIQRI